MRWLLAFFQRRRKRLDNGARPGATAPVFDAAESFFFSPDDPTPGAPHVRDPLDIKRYMFTVIVALLPCFAASIYFFGWRVLAMVLVSYVAGGTVEVLFAIAQKEPIKEGFLVTGLIFPLVLPPALPLWMVAAGIAFGVIVGKELFGGTGRNLFNPALVGRCFLALAYPAGMATSYTAPGGWPLGRLLEWGAVDTVTAATPLAAAKQGHFARLWDLFVGHVGGSAAETCVPAILIGGIFLLATGVANWRTVIAILASFSLFSLALHLADPDRFASLQWELCAGGILFGAFFMATDPVSSPAANGAKWVYGLLVGALVVLVRSFTGYVEGVTFAILLGNICAPLFDVIAERHTLRRLAREA